MLTAPIIKQLCTEAGLRTGTHPENLTAYRLHQWKHKPEQQHKVGRYRLDFAWPDLRIALEVDGPHHQRPDVAVKDTFRDQWLRGEGWIILRVNADENLEPQLASVSALIHSARAGGYFV